MKSLSSRYATLSCLLMCFSASVYAKPISTTPSREKARCQANVDLCDRVARDDLDRCQGAGQSHCSDNYYEDINQCTSDYHDCLDSIGLVKGSLGIHSAIGAGVIKAD